MLILLLLDINNYKTQSTEKLLIQWSQYAAKTATSFSWPLNFTTTIFQVVASPYANIAESVYMNKFPRTINTSGFVISKASDSFYMRYIVIGI